MAVNRYPQSFPHEPVGTEQTPLAANVWAHFGGAVTGQIAIGDGNILIDRSPGAYVKVTNAPPPRPLPRPSPVRWPPRDFPRLLGREHELGRASEALAAFETVEFHADSGWGKSVLLRHLSHRLPGEVVAGGLVFLNARGQYQDDLLQLLFDAFYETDVPFKPSPGQLRHYLAEVRAVLTFDDLGLNREQLAALADVVPNSPMLVASETRALWGEGEVIQLHGLEDDAALALLEREMGQPLTARERQKAIGLCQRVAGQPQAILQAAAVVRERRDSGVPVVSALEGLESGADIALRLVGSLPPAERTVLGILASQQGAPLTLEHVQQISRFDGVADVLQMLAEKGVAELTPAGWRFAGSLSPSQAALLSTDTWAAAVIDHVASWVEEQQGDPARIAWESQLVVRAAESAHRSRAWRALWRLARGASSAFLLSGLWDAWAVVLNGGLEAAEQLRDQGAQAWCLHQLGTRALCLGDADLARDLLRKALTIRTALKDRKGIAVTRHNLGLIEGTPPPWWTQGKVLIGGLVALMAILGAGFAVGHAAGPGPSPTPSSSSRPTSPSVPNLSPDSLDFGQVVVGGQTTRQVIVSDPGESPMTLGSVSVGGDFQQVNRCQRTLSPREQCSIDVTFHPTRVRRSLAMLTVAYGSGGSRTTRVSGEGVAPHLALDPSAVEFKSMQIGRTSAPATVHLRNPEAVPVGISRIATDGDFAVEGPCTGGPLTMSPGQVCDLAVRFKPTARGSRNGHLQAIGDAVTGSVGLSGFGGVIDLRFDPAPLDMGSQSVGLSNQRLVTLGNAGDAPFVAAKLVTTDGFLARGCQQVLEPNGTCRITVTFTPNHIGPLNGNLQVIDDAASTGGQLAVTGTGVVPSVAFDPDYGIDEHHPDTTTLTASLRVINKGPGTLVIRSVTLNTTHTGPDLLTVSSADCMRPIEPNGTCSILVTQAARPSPTPCPSGSKSCQPSLPSFSYLGSLEVSDNASGSPQQVGFEWTG